MASLIYTSLSWPMAAAAAVAAAAATSAAAHFAHVSHSVKKFVDIFSVCSAAVAFLPLREPYAPNYNEELNGRTRKPTSFSQLKQNGKWNREREREWEKSGRERQGER